MICLKWFILGILLKVYACKGYRILVFFPFPNKSHGLLGENMVKHFLAAGHEVTYVTSFIEKNENPKLHQIDVSDNIKSFNVNTMNLKKIMDKEMNFKDFDVLYNIMIKMASHTFMNPNVQKFIRNPGQTFDVVIAQWLFNEVYSSLGAIFDCPMIWFSPFEPYWKVLNLVDGPLNPAYSLDTVSHNNLPLSFFERVDELWTQVDAIARINFVYYYKEEKIYKDLIAPVIKEKGRPVPSYNVVKNNISLILGNTNLALGDGASLPQSYIHVGGYHIDEEVKPLPEDLKNIMDNAKNGVVYFSMGSNLKSKDLPIELIEGILKVFSDLKQTVIWKFEEMLSDAPSNVHIVHWAPQHSILAHPNMLAFITHGGQLSVTEAAHFGVPIITIPVFADQFTNANRAQRKGFGINLELSYKMNVDLRVALNEILSNKKYFDKAKETSRAFRNVPLKPKDSLTFWVNHVIETNGAPHLRSPGHQLPMYQRLYLDLIVSIIVVLVLIKYSISYFLGLSRKQKKVKLS